MLTSTNSLESGIVEEGTTATFIRGNETLRYVSDMTEQEHTIRPSTSWIYPIISTVGLLIFLTISFVRYHQRLRIKRDKEREYIEYFKWFRPESQNYEIKVSRARSVMTNTHVENIFDADVQQGNIMRHDGSFYSHDESLSYMHVPCYKHHTRKENTDYNDTFPDIHHARKQNTDYNDIHGTGLHFCNCEMAEIEIDNNLQRVYKSLVADPNIDKTAKGKPPSGKGFSCKCNSKKYVRTSKRRRKKARRSFRQRSDPKMEMEMEANKYSKPRVMNSDEGHDTQYAYDRWQSEPAVYMHYSDEEYVHDKESTDTRRPSQDSTNQYYLDCGLPVPTPRDKPKIKRFEAKSGSASYNVLTLKQTPQNEFKELTHRDRAGSINLNARSLPQLDSVYHENIPVRGLINNNFNLPTTGNESRHKIANIRKHSLNTDDMRITHENETDDNIMVRIRSGSVPILKFDRKLETGTRFETHANALPEKQNTHDVMVHLPNDTDEFEEDSVTVIIQ